MDRYEVDCYFCKNSFDALQADWCGCLTTEATFVCPGCSACFCKAPAAYKQKFWSEAPTAIWDKKWARHREKFEPKPNLDPANIKRPLILVVEDEKDIQRMAIQKLDDMGYGVILGKDGVEGLELAKKYMPDLILSDAMLPKMDGREMCRRVKEEPATSNIKVIIMTSLYTHLKYKLEAYKKFKVDEYLSKPIDFDQLRVVLDKYLDKIV